MTAAEKIIVLRDQMKEEGVSGYLIPSTDSHMTEYLPEHDKARSWFSGFDGSSGTLAVTSEKAALWTDGRYFVQAEKQLKGSGIKLMRSGEPNVKNVEEWLADEIPSGGKMGICGRITSVSETERLEKAFAEKKIEIKETDLISVVWGKERPPYPETVAWILEKQYAGASPSEKIEMLRAELTKEKADSMIIPRLDSVAWLLNIRAFDVKNTPFAIAFCLVMPKQVILFINQGRIPEAVKIYLEREGVETAPYHSVEETIASIEQPIVLLYEESGTNKALLNAIRNNSNITEKRGRNCIEYLKCKKNEVEIKNIKNAHIKDGIAMVRFAIQLNERMNADEIVTEDDVVNMVLAFRKEQEFFLEESFDTIAAYGSNAAMMHYHPTKEHCVTLKKKGFLLVDSGGQYRDGTTDITRTYALGEPTEEEKEYYTMVLRAHIRMAMSVLKDKSSGSNLDIIARELFWKKGLDYRCGTGHGVGFVGIIHEGPQNLNGSNQVPIQPGMILTDEPGIYEEGKIGIRIENELLCKEYLETEYGTFYAFEAITYCPIEKKAALVQLMQEDEIDWLNQYNAMVEKVLLPFLETEKEKDWLQQACSPLKK